MKPRKIRYAVVGLGNIAQEAVLPAFQNCENSELTAIVSNDPQKLEVLSRRYQLKNTFSYDEYDECLKEVDAVYIALPNHLHKEYTIRAAEAGVHVLCEKPMAVTSQDCLEMIQACEDHRVKLMIAYRLHFEETNLTAIHLAHDEKKLGDLKMFQSIHSQPAQYPNIRMLPTAKGGGPTYDMAIYDINAARYLFQEEPVSVFAEYGLSKKEPYRQIEESVAAILKFGGDRLASLLVSFGTVDTDTLRLVGSKGELSIDPAYGYVDPKTMRVVSHGAPVVGTFQARDQFSPEIDYFSECILTNREIEPSGEEGLADVRIIEAIHHSAQTGEIVELPKFEKALRPNLSQQMFRPPIEPPEPVHAPPPAKDEAA